MRQALSDGAAALWDPPAEAGPRGRSALLVFLGVTGAVALLLVARRLDGITNPQFWAEDGFVFFQDNLLLGCRTALATFFRGFPYVGQRLIACAATPVPLVHVPLAYNLAAYLIAAASLATFSLPAFRHVVRRDGLRIVFCLAVAAMPPARELVASLTNTSWFLGVWLFLLTVARLPASPLALLALAAAVSVATFSAPLAVVAAPLWLVRGLDAARRRRLGEASFAAVALASVVAVSLITNGLGRHQDPVPSLAWPVLNALSTRVLAALVLDPARIEGLVASGGPDAVYAVALATLAVLAALAWRAERRLAPVLLLCAYGIVGSLVLEFAGRPGMAHSADTIPALFRTRGWLRFTGRYQVMALAMAYLAVLAVLDRLPRTRWWSAATMLVLAWLVAALVPAFVLPPFLDLRWPEHAARLEHKLATHGLESVIIPINPDWTGAVIRIAVDPRRIMPEVRVPPETVLGTLAGEATVEQSFVAHCAGLSEIDLWLAAPASGPPPPLVVQLREAESGRVRATFTRDGSGANRLRDGAEPFFFEPIPESDGRRYVISVTAPGATASSAPGLLGSTADAYPAGDARRAGAPIPGDVAFRYGCSVR